jgi:chloride channel protein, CIC family
VTLVLEEIIGDLNSRFLGNMLMASILGALVAHGLLGADPAFRMDVPDEPGWEFYVLAPWAAALATFSGLLFQWSSLKLRRWTLTQKRVPPWAVPALGVIPAWALGIGVWLSTNRLGVFGLGYSDLSDALSGHLVWQIAALLLAAKLGATVLCYGCGGCGGIFAPTLLFGGMAGLTAAGLGSLILPVHGADQSMLAVVGMCACLGAVVRAPVTGILIVFEMTHQFSLVLPLMLGALVSQSISRRLMHANFYEAILEQDGHTLTRIIPPRDLESWQQLPVATIANFQPASVPDLELETLQSAFEQHPYAHFPWVEGGCVRGIVSRQDLERALLQKLPVAVHPAATADPQETIRVIQMRLIESGVGLIVLCDARKTLLGVVTLHDLIRAQLAYGDTPQSWNG